MQFRITTFCENKPFKSLSVRLFVLFRRTTRDGAPGDVLLRKNPHKNFNELPASTFYEDGTRFRGSQTRRQTAGWLFESRISPECGNDRELRRYHFWGRGTFTGGADRATAVADFSRGAISLQ